VFTLKVIIKFKSLIPPFLLSSLHLYIFRSWEANWCNHKTAQLFFC